MTRIVFVNPNEGKVLLQVDTQEAIPMVGDVVIPPNGIVHQVVQRAFIIEPAAQQKLVDLSKGQTLTVTIQCAVLPVQAAQSEGVPQ